MLLEEEVTKKRKKHLQIKLTSLLLLGNEHQIDIQPNLETKKHGLSIKK